ncbi:isoprenylcysteine carboxyl methyltransferase family protein [Neocallimastix lanati (nom. inval.)]|jgi:protein-S-isoprenylcysteine O-methyltransferase Ste14|uniref:Isoprenylcysteine carboxyl methyltransferase family protein n=1 Tax=Neocallimastix californiae TaxID=1754190 RepID=A0A1Y2DRG7_9FUNG|nr:isoprenylcysteine carboxyl methyltransferase family protein [Neocallimastix sp. JGI-2020a]ORY61871.1 isoprenylcysteine carboxyl methyltransferase family protein [Neocallimastix californiae]|eukprot:ORY61871.1 isoprenylcysteine carboxyl methyltransferase family protein [Neocallimastix californiae]
MDSKLFIQAFSKFAIGVLLVAALIFIPAWSVLYWQGWLFMGLLFLPMFLVGVVMLFKSPGLLRKRLNNKETEEEQKVVVIFSVIIFVSTFIVAGLNFKFKWIVLPDIVSYIASFIFLIGYVLYAEVLRENTFLSRTIEVQENQQVIDTGLYGLVRHPMYMSTLFLFLSIPLILGSLFSFIIMLTYIPIIIKRIRNEEKVLAESLDGYTEYMKRIKYRIIPYVW